MDCSKLQLSTDNMRYISYQRQSLAQVKEKLKEFQSYSSATLQEALQSRLAVRPIYRSSRQVIFRVVLNGSCTTSFNGIFFLLCCGRSSVGEHILHTDGVGSSILPARIFFCFLTVKYIYHTLPSLGDSLERVLSLDEEFTAIFGTVYKASLKAASNDSSFFPQKMTSPFSKF